MTGKYCVAGQQIHNPTDPIEWDADEFDSGMLVPRSVLLAIPSWAIATACSS
jgi:hypothetical protein